MYQFLIQAGALKTELKNPIRRQDAAGNEEV